MVLRKRRERKLSQRQLAVEVGCSQPYLAQVETGVRPISKRIAEKLETFFKVKQGTYTQVVFRRGRPPSGAATRGASQQIRGATGKAPRALESSGPPSFPRADRVSGLYLGEEAARQVRQLEAQRPLGEGFWRQLNGFHYDSWTEKLFQVIVGLTGAELTGVKSQHALAGRADQALEHHQSAESQFNGHPHSLPVRATAPSKAMAWSSGGCSQAGIEKAG